MDEAIKNFGKQFDYVPEIVNKENLKKMERVVVLGMGGSHLPADILRQINPKLTVFIHRDYGLPNISDEDLKESLIIASSYSGNTEEVLEGLHEALSKNLPCAVISVGGKLIEIAKEKKLPYIQLQDTGIQPRSALGFSLVGLSHLLSDELLLNEMENLKGKIQGAKLEDEGKKLAEDFKGLIPVIYTSNKNIAIGYNWKIKFNETGKIPAFYNILPEMNHNEMTGFDVTDKSKHLSEKFIAIFLKDSEDHPQIQKRMEVSKKLYEARGLKTISFNLSGESVGVKIFNSLLLADWIAFYTAALNGAESEQVPMVEEFKKLIA